ncbi:MAG: M20 family metallopeptidase [Deltaproteobacteria bacterium]|nr:M20 family metallopeptidase [Deltaproteobacteria bacterium]
MTNRHHEMKDRLSVEIGRLREEMVEIARSIHENPEIGYKEYESSKKLVDLLVRNGFDVTRGIAGMETAFIACYPEHSAGPTVAFIAEYDALSGLGHGCAHNLIGTAGAGAAVGLSKVFGELRGRIAVVGCPAEEAGVDGAGGKVKLVESGCFDGIDAAICFHPMPLTTVGGETTALIGLEFEFLGKAVHAAGNPWDGINALDGVLQTFNAVNALRQHVRDDIRIHGIVTHGGDAPNIVPERAAARFFIRSSNSEALKDTVDKVKRCAQGAAMATGATLNINVFNNLYESMRSNATIAEAVSRNLERAGLRIEGRKKGRGSTDFGNVSRVVPSCELAVRLGDRIFPHTREFLHASNSEEGFRVMMLGAEIMAQTAMDLFAAPELLEKAKKEFRTEPG